MNDYREISAQVFAEKFLQILSNPKNSSVNEYLTDGWDSDIIGVEKERKE